MFGSGSSQALSEFLEAKTGSATLDEQALDQLEQDGSISAEQRAALEWVDNNAYSDAQYECAQCKEKPAATVQDAKPEIGPPEPKPQIADAVQEKPVIDGGVGTDPVAKDRIDVHEGASNDGMEIRAADEPSFRIMDEAGADTAGASVSAEQRRAIDEMKALSPDDLKGRLQEYARVAKGVNIDGIEASPDSAIQKLQEELVAAGESRLADRIGDTWEEVKREPAGMQNDGIAQKIRELGPETLARMKDGTETSTLEGRVGPNDIAGNSLEEGGSFIDGGVWKSDGEYPIAQTLPDIIPPDGEGVDPDSLRQTLPYIVPDEPTDPRDGIQLLGGQHDLSEVTGHGTEFASTKIDLTAVCGQKFDQNPINACLGVGAEGYSTGAVYGVEGTQGPRDPNIGMIMGA